MATPVLKLNEHWTDYIIGKPQDKLECKICNVQLKSRESARCHANNIHLGIRYPCTYCDHKATTSYSLRLHIETQHLNEKAQCSYCGKQISKAYIKTHIRTEHEHSAKIHKCGQCSYETTHTDNLKEHIMVKHEKIERKCSQCDYKAKWIKQIREHKRKEHSLEGNN